MAETLCFQMIEYKKDITSCQLTIEGDKVTGFYDWTPDQKDGGHGILINGVKKGDMITADWRYFIEGSDQTEEVILKLEADKVTKMTGELVEKGTKMVLKNPAKAKAGDVLKKVDCAKIAATVKMIGEIPAFKK